MKKHFALILALLLALSLTACGSSDSEGAGSGAGGAGTAIAICTDGGSIDDSAANQACYAGIQTVAEQNGLDYAFYIPAGSNTDARETSLRQAINDGATTIVTVGSPYAPALEWATGQYPDVDFIGVDVAVSDLTAQPAANLYCVSFREEQAGYLAGYAAVADGNAKLGFLGGAATPGTVRYAYGFIQGADAAAQELNSKVSISVWYCGQDAGGDAVTAKMNEWYAAGTQTVFACGGSVYTSALAAAVQYGGTVIGAGTDRSGIGSAGVSAGTYSYNPFLTSAVKGYQAAVEAALATRLDGKWDTLGGTSANLGLQEGEYVGLAAGEGAWNFKTFTTDQYDAAVKGIRSGSTAVADGSAGQPATSANITVTYLN